MRKLLLIFLSLSVSVVCFANADPRLLKGSRLEKSGWIYVHLEGSPREIGYQHGYLLANEIDDALHMMKYFFKISTGKTWNLYRDAVRKMSFWTKMDKEYQDEISGIVEGLKAKGKIYDIDDIVVLNANIELTQYYLPYLNEKIKP